MRGTAVPSCFGAGRKLPADPWRAVHEEAGCATIRQLACPEAWAARIARDLQHGGAAHAGIAYERTDGTRWDGLDAALVEADARDEDQNVPQLRAVLVGELFHLELGRP